VTTTIISSEVSSQPTASGETATTFVEYLFLRVDPAWRRLSAVERARGRGEFAEVVRDACPTITTHTYSTLGFKASADLLLWWRADRAEMIQDTLSALLLTGFGSYCQVAHTLFGLTRPSTYTKRRTVQEQALDETTRLPYLIVYPFVKTTDWYLLNKDVRQGLMNEHMRVGHEYSDVRQTLVYTTGLDDQEFVVAYETDRLERHQELVIALRATDSRRYTLRDTPIFTAIHRPLDVALSLLG
jgi:chlorite dismutase